MTTQIKASNVRVFVYGCLPPTIGAAPIDEQLAKAHRYYNRLIQLERSKRTAIRQAQVEIIPGLNELQAKRERLDARLCQVVADIRSARAKDRTRNTAGAEVVNYTDLCKEMKEVNTLIKQTKAPYAKDPALLEAYGKVNAEFSEKKKEERSKCGLYWSTYNLIEEDVDRAAKSKVKPRTRLREDGTPYTDTDPYFKSGRDSFAFNPYDRSEENTSHRFFHEGRLGVQIQGGMTVEGLKDSTQLQIALPPSKVYDIDDRDKRKPLTYTTVKFRVESLNRKPVFAELPIQIHRPLPEDAKIKSAWLQRTKRFGEDAPRYKLGIVLESNDFFRSVPTVKQEGTATINFGWRKLTHGSLRIAMVNSDVHGLEEIKLTDHVLRRFKKCDDLQSIVSQQFNTTLAELNTWLGKQPLDSLPDWLAGEYIRGIHAWKQELRLYKLGRHWKDNRFAGDEMIFPAVAYWMERWYHLARWKHDNNVNGLNIRMDTYRKIAYRLVHMHAVIVMEDFNLSDVAKKPEIGETRGNGGGTASKQRVRAAIHSLRQAIINAAQHYHCEVRIVPPQKNTLTCNVCNFVMEERPKGTEYTCSHCKAALDQDVNATDNMHDLADDGLVVVDPQQRRRDVCEM